MRSAPPPRGSRALYRARARGSRSSSSQRAAVGSRGGRAGAPSSALASPLPPDSAPRPPPPPSPRRPRKPTFRPSPPLRPLFVLVRAALRRAEGSSQPSLLAAPLQDPEKNVDHTPVRLLRYRLLVQGKLARGEGRRAAWNPWSPETWLPGRVGREPSELTFRVEGSPGVSSPVCLRLWAWRPGRERVAAGAAALLPRPRCRDFPDSLRRPPRGHGPGITWLVPARPGWASPALSGLFYLFFANVTVEAELKSAGEKVGSWGLGVRSAVVPNSCSPSDLNPVPAPPTFGRQRNPWPTSI